MLLVVFQFNADCKISKEDRHYNTNPTLNDKVHILVCVIDANTTSLIKGEVLLGIQDIRDEASELGECNKKKHCLLTQEMNILKLPATGFCSGPHPHRGQQLWSIWIKVLHS